MKRLKKILRLCGLVLFMVLASVGIGITGGAATLPKRSERNTGTEALIELVQESKGDEELQADKAFN